jgi:hypothetical protein
MKTCFVCRPIQCTANANLSNKKNQEVPVSAFNELNILQGVIATSTSDVFPNRINVIVIDTKTEISIHLPYYTGQADSPSSPGLNI